MVRRRHKKLGDEDWETGAGQASGLAPPPDTEKAFQTANPATLSRHLHAADLATQSRVIANLQQQRGNAFVQEVVRGVAAHQAGQGPVQHGGSGVGIGRGGTITVEREADEADLEGEGPGQMQQAGIPAGATEEIGPETNTSYPLTASNLNAVAPLISGPDEAGKTTWGPHMDYRSTGAKMTSVKITAWINVEMPAWTPPPSMGPKAKAEWDRWYAALLAHEMGHVKLVHDKMDGLASQIVGMTERAGKALFENRKAELHAASRAFDGRTGGGTKTGTIIDPTIEDREIDDKKREEEEKKRKAGQKSEADVPAAPDDTANA
jgi:hypothetical protein